MSFATYCRCGDTKLYGRFHRMLSVTVLPLIRRTLRGTLLSVLRSPPSRRGAPVMTSPTLYRWLPATPSMRPSFLTLSYQKRIPQSSIQYRQRHPPQNSISNSTSNNFLRAHSTTRDYRSVVVHAFCELGRMRSYGSPHRGPHYCPGGLLPLLTTFFCIYDDYDLFVPACFDVVASVS